MCYNLRGQDLGRKVGDVGGDGPARQELGHLVGEGVAVVLEQAIPVAPAAEQRTPKRVFSSSFRSASGLQRLQGAGRPLRGFPSSPELKSLLRFHTFCTLTWLILDFTP